MKDKKIGIVIGRFQPFHFGHKYLIEKSLQQVDQLIIGLGSTNINNEDNPFDKKKRMALLKKFVKEEELTDRIKKIITIDDHPDDDVWLSNLLKKTGKVDVVFGDNEWVNGIFENVNTEVVRIGLFNRDLFEGKKIRKLMESRKEWKERIPEYLREFFD